MGFSRQGLGGGLGFRRGLGRGVGVYIAGERGLEFSRLRVGRGSWGLEARVGVRKVQKWYS